MTKDEREESWECEARVVDHSHDPIRTPQALAMEGGLPYQVSPSVYSTYTDLLHGAGSNLGQKTWKKTASVYKATLSYITPTTDPTHDPK